MKFIDLFEDLEGAKEILSNFEWGDGKKGFSHRFIRIEDVLDLLGALRELLSAYSSLGELARSLYEERVAEGDEEPIGSVIKGLASEIRNRSPELIEQNKVIIPSPSGNSAMKRMSHFVRWMTRPYPDLGLWNFIEPKHLLISLDSGIMRSARRAFNIQLAKQASWRNVLKVTRLFREINPDDPAKYDYVFSKKDHGILQRRSSKKQMLPMPSK